MPRIRTRPSPPAFSLTLPRKQNTRSVSSLNNKKNYIDLARTKSEALDNFYSLLKQNIKSLMLSGEGNENGKKKKTTTTIGLMSKKATLHVQHTFFVHFFAAVLHDCYVKLPEAS